MSLQRYLPVFSWSWICEFKPHYITPIRYRKGKQRKRWLDDIINTMDMDLSKLGEVVKDREA